MLPGEVLTKKRSMHGSCFCIFISYYFFYYINIFLIGYGGYELLLNMTNIGNTKGSPQRLLVYRATSPAAAVVGVMNKWVVNIIPKATVDNHEFLSLLKVYSCHLIPYHLLGRLMGSDSPCKYSLF